MKGLRKLKDKLTSLVFGANNERLDFLVDSFNRLDSDSQYRTLLISAVGYICVLMIVGVFLHSMLTNKENEMRRNIHNMSILKRITQSYLQAKQNFNKFEAEVEGTTRNLNIKSLVDSTVSRITGQRAESIELRQRADPTEAVSAEVYEVDLRNINYAQVISTLSEIEKGGKYLQITNLRMRPIFGNKKLFQVSFRISTLVLNSQSSI